MSHQFPLLFPKRQLALLIDEHSIPIDTESKPHWIKFQTVDPFPSGEAIVIHEKAKLAFQWSIRDGVLHFTTKRRPWKPDARRSVTFIETFVQKVLKKAA